MSAGANKIETAFTPALTDLRGGIPLHAVFNRHLPREDDARAFIRWLRVSDLEILQQTLNEGPASDEAINAQLALGWLLRVREGLRESEQQDLLISKDMADLIGKNAGGVLRTLGNARANGRPEFSWLIEERILQDIVPHMPTSDTRNSLRATVMLHQFGG